MSNILLENDRQREEFYKVALYLILIDDLERELTRSEDKALNSIFFDINFYPDYKSSDDLNVDKRDELIDIKDKVIEICIENTELYYRLLDENVFKDLYSQIKESSDSSKNVILMKLYFTALNYLEPNEDQERFLEYITELLEVDDEFITCLTESASDIRELIADAKTKGGVK